MVLGDCTLPNVRVLCVDGKSMSHSEAKTKCRQSPGARYSADLEESRQVRSEEVVSINLLAHELGCEVDWGLVDLTGGPGIGIQASICCDYGRLHEAC